LARRILARRMAGWFPRRLARRSLALAEVGFFSEPLAFSGGSHRLILVQAFSNPLGIDVDKKSGSAGWIRIFGFR